MSAAAEFAYCVCQPGAEPALKAEVSARVGEWRFAFSRPGFVTFKLPSPVEPYRFEPVRLTFARAVGLSYGRVEAESPEPQELARRLWEHPAMPRLSSLAPLALHVWERDRQLPGEDGVEPGPTAGSLAAVAALRESAPPGVFADHGDGLEGGRARVALDVALVEPNQWWLGAHALRSRVDRWPGGAPGLELPSHAVSRAYLKMQEGLRWSALPVTKGDVWVEFGCAPGGASQALLEAGMRVVGVDPAEVEPVVVTVPAFRHFRGRSLEVPIEDLAEASWVAVDVNCAPQTTLEAVERLVTHPSTHVRGLLLTLKLLSPHLARPDVIAEIIDVVRSWGFGDVRTRQLAHNRREFCLAAVRSRAQRRIARGRRESLRAPRKGGESPAEASEQENSP